MKSIATIACALFFILLTSGTALAESGIPWVGSITAANSAEASLYILPDGSGPALTQAMLFGGQVVDASLQVILIDINFDTIGGFPVRWLTYSMDLRLAET